MITAPCKRYNAQAGRDSRNISYTDRLYARLTVRGQVVVEITRDRFASLSSLLDTLRMKVPHASGLARLTIRNMTRGWTLERPLMLYSEIPTSFNH